MGGRLIIIDPGGGSEGGGVTPVGGGFRIGDVDIIPGTDIACDVYPEAKRVVIRSTAAAGSNPLTTKGDVMAHDGAASTRVPVGADGEVLTADSADADGVSWQAPGAGGAHAASHQNNGADEISVAGLSGVLADAQTPAAHTHAQGDVTDLTADLADKSDVGHTHVKADVTDFAHTHAQADVTNLTTDLAAKEAAANKGAANGYAGLDAGSKVPTANLGGAGADATKFLRGDQTWQVPSAGGGFNTLKKTADQTINGGAATFVNITDLTFPVVAGVDYAFHFYITFRSAQTTTGWKSGLNHPGGTLDFWAKSDVIANGAAGVATHTERHNVAVDDMTLLTSTVTAGVDLAIIIEGRYKCTANGTFAARFANELAANTDLVVQKGSWGWWF